MSSVSSAGSTSMSTSTSTSPVPPRRNMAVVFTGTNQVEVRDIGYPKLRDPSGNDAPHAVILKVLASGICGSDLHMYRGRTDVTPGMVLGHEITGEVLELGADVRELKVGDVVSVPFNVACGRCANCKERKTQACLRVNPKMAGGIYGYVDMGSWAGGQAEYVMVPYADFQCLVLPREHIRAHIKDLALLSDVLPTGFHAAQQAGVCVGSTVYVAGAGPVGLCCAASALLLGAAAVVVGDVRADRLANARKLGCLTIDLTAISSMHELRTELSRLVGKPEVDCSCDCVGYEASGIGAEHTENRVEGVLNTCVHATQAGGGISVPGLYLPSDPQGKTSELRRGIVPLEMGLVWFKGLHIGTGQCPVMAHHRQLMMAILHQRIKVSDALNVQFVSLEKAPEAYARFSAGYPAKFVIDPHGEFVDMRCTL